MTCHKERLNRVRGWDRPCPEKARRGLGFSHGNLSAWNTVFIPSTGSAVIVDYKEMTELR